MSPTNREAIQEFFTRWPLDKTKSLTLSSADFFLAFLWLRGYKVVRVAEGEYDDR